MSVNPIWAKVPTLNENDLKWLYWSMLRIRLFEEEILKGETAGLAIHSCAGHEAVAVGIMAHLTKQDLIVSNHRPWGHFLAKGGTMRESFAEIMGKKTGVSKGIGGEMGICKPEIGFVQSTMIVGACLTLACGVALSIQRRQVGKDHIAVVFFGEGASTNGAFHEALTLAKVFQLPLLFVCENNGLSGNTSASDYMPTELVVHRAAGYGFPTNVCDGSDVLAVWEAGQRAVECVRKTRSPYLLECLVARINRHKVPRFPDSRPPEVKRIARMRDPIPKLKNALMSEGLLIEDEQLKLSVEILAEVKDALEFAKGS